MPRCGATFDENVGDGDSVVSNQGPEIAAGDSGSRRCSLISKGGLLPQVSHTSAIIAATQPISQKKGLV